MTALKLRSKVNFPATVTATGGLAVVKANGIWTVRPDWSYLTLETTIADASARQLWTWDGSAYRRLSVQALIGNLPAGPPGSAATIAAGTTTTGKAGTSATAANSGTSSAAVLDFSIPRGADAGMRYAFESSTSMAAPASGGVRLNNASLASVTAIAVNASNLDGIDVSDFVATWDDSTNAVKGYLEARKEGSGAVLGLFQITSVTDNTTWLQIAVSYVSGSGSFAAADSIYLTPYRTGNKGTDGVGTGDVVGPASSVDNEIALYSGTTGKLIKRASTTGMLKASSGVIAAAVAGTDYVGPTTGSAIQKASSGGLTAATAGTDFMRPDTTSALTAGFTSASVSAGTKSSGTYTFDPTAGAVQHATNGGAHTFAPPATMGAWMLDYVNNASAGAITTSGWTKVDGDPFTTTNGNSFRCMISVGNQGSYLSVKRMV